MKTFFGRRALKTFFELVAVSGAVPYLAVAGCSPGHAGNAGADQPTGGALGSGGSTTGTGGTVAGSGGAGSNGLSGAAATGGDISGKGGAATRGGTGGNSTAAAGTFGENGGAAGGAGGTGASAATGGTPGSHGPPMGWSSWNSLGRQIGYGIIKQQADAMVSSGMAAAGYQYVNVDDGWWSGERDAAGSFKIDTASQWPGGMEALTGYLHQLGLKAGIYTDAGRNGCGGDGLGSEGHYDQDFTQFSEWGFDFVKIDWCGGDNEGLDPGATYQAISDSIKKATAQTGLPMVLSICNWGRANPWEWAPNLATMWRTGPDIYILGEQPEMANMYLNFDLAQHPEAQSPGHYNDPDMLMVGMPGFSRAQNRTHFALWAISGAPLLAGNDLTKMDADVKSILTNRELVAIDQDELAQQGTRVSDDHGLQVYSKVLSGNNRRAVLLLNRSGATGTITVRFADIGLGTTASVRDIWAAQDLGAQMTSYAASVSDNDSVLLLITGS